MVAVIKPLRKWGPVDPIMRYSWVQWHSKAKNGERDFTLKRRGTRDYTHSVKKKREPYVKPHVSTISDNSTLSRESFKTYHQNDHNQNNIKNQSPSLNGIKPLRIHVNSPYQLQHSKRFSDSGEYTRTLHVTSLVDALDPPNMYNSYGNRNSYPNSNVNPLSLSVNAFRDVQNESSTSEGYGTFRKGPYIVPDKKVEHVCHRKYSESEISTAL